MIARGKGKLKIGSFGRLIRRHRESLGLTMSELARRIEMDQGLLSKIERGKRPPPQLVPHVQRIGAALGMGIESAEFKELVEAAYRERFPREKWPAILSLEPGEGGVVELVRIPVHRSGLGGYTPPTTRESVRPDSPAGLELGLRPDGSLPPPDLTRELISSIPGPTPEDHAHFFLCQLHITDVERNGENFRFYARDPLDGKTYEVNVCPMGESGKDK